MYQGKNRLISIMHEENDSWISKAHNKELLKTPDYSFDSIAMKVSWFIPG